MPKHLAVALGLALSIVASSAQQLDVTVDSPPSLNPVADRLKTMDVAAVSRALENAGLSLPQWLHIVLLESSDPAARQFPRWIVGQVFNVNSVVIFPDRVGAYPYGSLEAVFIHEIAHVALSNRAAERALPRWFHEGVAMSVESGWGLGSQMRLLAATWREPQIDDVSALFASDDWGATTSAYLLSAALIEDIRRRHGRTTPGLIAERVARGELFEEAFHRQTGETPDQAAVRAWRVYRGLRWVPFVTSSTSLWAGVVALAVIAFAVRKRRRREKHRQWDIEERVEPMPAESSGSVESDGRG